MAGNDLTKAALVAQADRRLSPTFGHQVYGAFADANVQIVGALSRTAEGHRMLERIAGKFGLDVTAFGDGLKDADDAFTSATLASPQLA